MRLWLPVPVLALICSLVCFASTRDQRAHGASLFATTGCMHCHTIHHAGGSKAPDLSGVGRRLNEIQMRQQIISGSLRMPPFGDELQASELADLLAYLRSCRDKKE